MTKFSRFITRLAGVAALATLSLGLPALARAEAVTDANVAAKVEAAKTAADHEAIAKFYRDQAAASSAFAAQHESMLKGLKTVGGKPLEVWRAHCERLIASAKQVAADYLKLAEEQEQLAKAAK